MADTIYVREGVTETPNGSETAPYNKAADYLATLDDPSKSTAKIMVWAKGEGDNKKCSKIKKKYKKIKKTAPHPGLEPGIF